MDGYADSIIYDERDAERKIILASLAERGSVKADEIIGESGCPVWQRILMDRGEW